MPSIRTVADTLDDQPRQMWFILLSLLLLARTQAAETNSEHPGIEAMSENVIGWTDQLSREFHVLQALTGEDYLRKIYEKPKFGEKEMTEELAFSLLDKVIGKLRKIVQDKAQLVDNIKMAAEDSYANRTKIDPDVCNLRTKAVSREPIHLEPNVTTNCSMKQHLPMTKSGLFDCEFVSFNHSVAHVPTNVYDFSKKLTDVSNWTFPLDEVFKSNMASDQTLKWQYYCDATGFFKFYPGAMWEMQLEEMRLDFFDCRSQTWYLSASAYAKEMVILVDKSGSMKGRNDIISNATISEILNTLTDNDFFNVLMFSDVPKYSDSATTGKLIQATRYNKDRIIHSFKTFSPNGTAHYERALTEAFHLLNTSQDPPANSKHCNRMIMVITDSVPNTYQTFFEQQNKEKNVRIFVYLLGQHSSAEPYVEEMACLNRGYSVNIATLADVKENVLKYLDVVARSNALANDSFTVWTGASVRQFDLRKFRGPNQTDTLVMAGKKHVPLIRTSPAVAASKEKTIKTLLAPNENFPVLFTSVAKAVYDRTPEGIESQMGKLLGVTGIDVPLQSFKDTIRGWELGVNNYLFAVDNNGFILFHPLHRPMHKNVLKSYYQNVDINEVEIPMDVKVDYYTAAPKYNTPLRQSLVNRQRAVNELIKPIITDEFHTQFNATMKYFSQALPDTPFTFVLAIHWNEETGRGHPIPAYDTSSLVKRQQKQPTSTTEKSRVALTSIDIGCDDSEGSNKDGVTLIPYAFCQLDEPLIDLYLKHPVCVAEKVIRFNELENTFQCDQEYLNRLQLDAQQTDGLHAFWAGNDNSPSVKKLGIQQAFSFHHSGLIRYHNVSDVVYPNFIYDHIGGVEDPLYAETVLTKKYFSNRRILVFRPPPNDLFRHYTTADLAVPISVTMSVTRGPQHIPMAVVGLQVTQTVLQDIFIQTTNSCFTQTGPCVVCSSEDVHCYVINQAGLVVMSNRGVKQIGRSLKEVNCPLAEDMINKTVLIEQYVYNFQGICIESRSTTQSIAIRLMNPVLNVCKLAFRFISEVIFLSIGLLVTNFPTPIFSQGWESSHLNPLQSYNQEYYSNNQVSQNPVNEVPSLYGPFNQYDSHQFTTNLHKDTTLPIGQPALPDYAPSDIDFSLPPLPTLAEMSIDNDENETSDSTEASENQTEDISQLKLREEPVDDPLNSIVEDAYDVQQQALAAIDNCLAAQQIRDVVTIHADLEISINESVAKPSAVENGTENATTANVPASQPGQPSTGAAGSRNNSQRPPPPGTLLTCIHSSVQQRCHSGAGTSSFTSRYTCEAVCEVIRQRIPSVADQLEDCKQPLTACTERYFAASVQVEKQPIKETFPRSTRESLIPAGGEYCQTCGGRRWWLNNIPGTNLFLLVDVALPGTATRACNCDCMKRYRYGARILTNPEKPRASRTRRDPPQPDECMMIPASMENSSVCTDSTSHISIRVPTVLHIIISFLLSSLF